MQLSEKGRALIQGFESYSSKAYRDADGYSIGYGHFLGKEPSLASKTITRDEAERLFDADVAKFEAGVSLDVSPAPATTQHQFDAMVSLAYNIGLGNQKTGKGGFTESTVRRRHNLGDTPGAADAFRMWVKSTGPDGVKRDNPTLVRRREQERAVYLGGYDAPGSFPSPPASSTPETPPAGWQSMPAPTDPQSSWTQTNAPASLGVGALLLAALAAFGWRLLHR